MAAQEIQVPDIGDFKNVEIIDVLVKAGDRVEVDTPLLTLETEKATMDVPAPVAGVIEKLLVKKGDRVSAGTAVAMVQAAGASAPAAGAPKPAAAGRSGCACCGGRAGEGRARRNSRGTCARRARTLVRSAGARGSDQRGRLRCGTCQSLGAPVCARAGRRSRARAR